MNLMDENEIEYRRGSAGGGNQLRQPYLKEIVANNYCKEFVNTERVHFYGFYIGNYPDLSFNEIDEIVCTLNKL